MPRRGRPPKSWKELYEQPLLRPRTEEELKEYELAVTSPAHSPTGAAKQRRGRPRLTETGRDLKIQEACGHIRWMMELDAEDPVLQAEVETWLIETRLSSSSIWEAELHPDDWARVSGSDVDFNEPAKRKVLERLIRRVLASQEAQLDIVLRIVVSQLGLDGPNDIEAIRQYRAKGSATERRRRARGE